MNNRNEPCWCGCGKKYKKCHLQADEAFDRATITNEQRDIFKNKHNKSRLLALETIIQESMYYKFTGR